MKYYWGVGGVQGGIYFGVFGPNEKMTKKYPKKIFITYFLKNLIRRYYNIVKINKIWIFIF